MNTARAEGLVACTRCTRVWPPEHETCQLCRKRLHPRRPHSVQMSLAFLVTAVVCYFPANMLPIMNTVQLGQSQENTILGGVLVLWQFGAYPTAMVIFVASVLIPIGKIMALAWLAITVSRRDALPAHRHSTLFKVVELIGTWSMVDVFVVAMLVALVRFSSILTIAPGPAALAFCGMVVFTILAAQAFDARLVWDKAHE